MSTTIDQNVVEMRFDNKHFESNVSTSMSTLDKLKQKLRFDGATKGLENVNSAASKVNMSGLSNGVDTVKMKFSAMEIIGITALTNITNSAVNAGKRIVSALTIDPVKTGFKEYETQINAVQTILANTQSKGTTIDDVNKALDELNTYADKTIYNFTEMTRNIGTFTAAGVDLETATNAIQGIANLAAVSGSSSQQASTAMYQLSQALSSGTVKLMDWNSVVNAGMGGQVFQDALKETARVHGVAIDDMIESEGSFRETLREGWLTSEILTETLEKFTLTTEGLTEAEIKANRERLKAKGYTDEQIDGIFKLGQTSTDAATKVKTFTQLFDVLKEAAQSGWAKTWQTIFGDFEEAKAFFTPLANTLTGFVNGMSDARNRVLEIALDFAKPWKAMSEKLKGLTKIADKVKSAGKSLEYFQDVVNKVWRGDFNNWGDNPDRFNLLEKAGYDHRVVQDLVNKGYQYKLTVEDIEASHKKFGLTMETTTEETENVTKAVNTLTDEQLKNAGLTEDEIRLYRALEKEAKRLGISVDDLATEMSETNGRDLLIGSLKDIGSAFLGIGKAVKEAWAAIFLPPSTEETGIRLYGIIKSIKKFTESLRLTKTVVDENGKEITVLNENGEKLKRTFEGIFAVLDILVTLINIPLKIAFSLAKALLEAFGFNILDVTACIGDFLVKIRDWIDGLLDFSGIAGAVVNPIKKAINAFKEWINTLKKSENLPQDIAKGIASGFSKAFKAIVNFFKQLPHHIKTGFSAFKDSPIGGFLGKIINAFKIAGQTIVELGKIILEKINGWLSSKGFKTISIDCIRGLVNGFKEGAIKVWNAAVNMVKTLVTKVKSFLGIHSPSKVFYAIGGFIIAGLIAGLQNGIPDSMGAIKDVFQPMLDWIKGIDFGAIVAGIFTVGTSAAAYKAVGSLYNFSVMFRGVGVLLEDTGDFIKAMKRPIANVVKGFAKIEKALAFEMRMEGVKTLATSLLMLAAAVAVLSFIKPAKLWNAVGVIAVLAVILGALAFAMGKINSASAKFNFKEGLQIGGLMSGIASIGAAVLLMGLAAKLFASLDTDELKRSLGSIGLILMALLGIMALMAYMNKGATAESAAATKSLGKMLKGLASALLRMTLVVWLLGSMSPDKIKQGIAVISAFMVMIMAVMAIATFFNEQDAKAVGRMLKNLASSLLLMTVVVWLLGTMDQNKLIQGGIAILALGAIIAGLMWTTKFIGNNTSTISKPIIAVAGAIAILGLTALMMSNMTWEGFAKGAAMIVILGGIVVGLMAATKLIGKNASKITKSFLSLAGAIAILGLTALLLSMISWAGFAKGAIMITLLGGIVVGLMAATKLVGPNVRKIGPAILSIAGAIAILGLCAYLLGLVNPEKLAQGLGVVAALAAIVSMLMAFSSKTGDCMKTVLAIAGVIVALAGAVWLISTIPAEQAIASAIVLGGLLVVMTFILKQMVKIGQQSKDAFKGVLALSALLVPLVGLVIILGMMQDMIYILEHATVLTAFAWAMMLLLYPLKALGKHVGDALKGVLALTALVIPLLGFAGALAIMQNVENAVTNAIILTDLATVMTILLVPLTIIGKQGMAALKGALALATMALPLIAFVGILAVMQNVKVAADNVHALIDLAIAMTILLIPLTLIGTFIMSALMGVVALTGMAVPLLAFVGVLALMSGIENATVNATALVTLITAIGDVLVKISLVAPLALVAVAAVTALIAVIGVVAVLATALGALMDTIPALQTFLDVGIKIMVKLADGIGQMIGAFISAIAGEVMQILPPLGLCLSQFMTNAMPFIIGAKMVDSSVLAGVGILAAAIVALTVADLINGVLSFLQMGSSFADLGTELSNFITNAMPFITAAATITPDMVSGVRMLADAILILTAGNLLESLTSFITGGSSLEDFADQLPLLGEGLAGFSASLGTFTADQTSTVNCAAQAIKTLAQAADTIPNSGGWVGAICGENDLGKFADQFPKLGTGLAQFLSNVGTFSDDQIKTVNCAAQAVKTLAEVAATIPNSGGWVGKIVGENDLGTFADQFPKLGSGLSGFLSNAGTFSSEQLATVDCAAQAVKKLADVSNEIPNSGGWASVFAGENDLDSFASQFPKLGTGLVGFLTNAGTFSSEQLATVDCAAQAVKKLAQVSASIPNSGGWAAAFTGDNDLGDFANKFPSVGTGLKGLVTNLGTFSEAQVITVQCAMDALRAIANLANTSFGNLAMFVDGFGGDLPSLGTNIKKFCTKIPAPETISAAMKSLTTLVDGINKIANVNTGPLVELATNLSKVGRDAVKKFVESFTNSSAVSDVSNAAKKLGEKAVKGLESKKAAMKTAGKTLGKKAADGLEDYEDEAKTSGKNLGAGYVKGIKAKEDAVYNAAYKLGQLAAQGLNDGQESQSPSKLAAQSGKWLGEGYIIGIGKMGKQVDKAGHMLGSTATDAISSTVSKIASLVNTDIDSQPTIRPVLDLSDVRSGANALNSMLGMNSRVGVMANVGTISSMMNSRSQNGVNDDVVLAINKLNKKMDNLGNTTYTINGVTYDDGSNITEAVRTIVRAAQIERRV